MSEIHNTYGVYQGKTVTLNAQLTCPHCGHRQTDLMPTDACVYFYECSQCRAILKPLPGHCCVYCSYGTVACPPIQAGTTCCS
ncbi:GDCCVxC domain-containing (seleno)protein [Spirosoma luteum]|uniref:GDCCVxC domain-containing (seleno)protein n=1 Tax=Spirosoma luteum TaxID=431553 RepID=UPI0009FC25BB|nr:GDCCVxC domain-containing (seleno)protein [Spirosoma luteum]